MLSRCSAACSGSSGLESAQAQGRPWSEIPASLAPSARTAAIRSARSEERRRSSCANMNWCTGGSDSASAWEGVVKRGEGWEGVGGGGGGATVPICRLGKCNHHQQYNMDC